MKPHTKKNNRLIRSNHVRSKHRNTVKRRAPQKQTVVVVGKVYAEWCGHCKAMRKDWEKLRTHFERQSKRFPHAKTVYKVVSISSDELQTKKPQVEQMYLRKTGQQIDVKGFPTIFKITDGKLEYYDGQRTYSDMVRWFSSKPVHFPQITF